MLELIQEQSAHEHGAESFVEERECLQPVESADFNPNDASCYVWSCQLAIPGI